MQQELLLIHTPIHVVVCKRHHVKQGVEAKRWQELSFSFITKESGGESTEEIAARLTATSCLGDLQVCKFEVLCWYDTS